jgi:ribosomal protein S18 acetylase RimI-like enzyme
MIEYKSSLPNKEQIRNLYLDNKWYAYTNDFDMLMEGIKQSTDVVGGYDGELLVGLIRTVSDHATICYIQDILVLDSHKHKGIGSTLLQMIFDKYKDVRQVVLMTDVNDERSNKFYKKLGMVEFKDKDCIGYILKK